MHELMSVGPTTWLRVVFTVVSKASSPISSLQCNPYSKAQFTMRIEKRVTFLCLLLMVEILPKVSTAMRPVARGAKKRCSWLPLAFGCAEVQLKVERVPNGDHAGWWESQGLSDGLQAMVLWWCAVAKKSCYSMVELTRSKIQWLLWSSVINP